MPRGKGELSFFFFGGPASVLVTELCFTCSGLSVSGIGCVSLQRRLLQRYE